VGRPDDNTHAPNEFFQLSHFYQGMRAVAHLWDDLGAGALTR
jgi:hypothetical protein